MSLPLGISRGISNKDYHADRTYVSSSGLKDILKDPKKFHSKYILNLVDEKKKDTSSLDEGSYAHSLILEPELIPNEYRFFPGDNKKHPDWNQFKKDNEGYILLSKGQKVRTESLFIAYEKMPVAVELMKGCEHELTCCTNLNGIDVKVRADAINIQKGYIVDIKTIRFTSEKGPFQSHIETFNYLLSAALYTMVFSKILGKPLDFYFLVLGKEDYSCSVYKVSSESMAWGMSQVNKALELLTQYRQEGWKFEESPLQNILKGLEYTIEEV